MTKSGWNRSQHVEAIGLRSVARRKKERKKEETSKIQYPAGVSGRVKIKLMKSYVLGEFVPKKSIDGVLKLASHRCTPVSGFWGEHRAILCRVLELNKLKWDSYNAVFLMGYTCTCIYFNHWERDVFWLRTKSLMNLTAILASIYTFWQVTMWPQKPMALLQIPKNHKACPLELRACIPENSGIIEAYP